MINVLKTLPNVFYVVSLNTLTGYGTEDIVHTHKDVDRIKNYYMSIARDFNEDFSITVRKFHLSNDELQEINYDADQFLEFIDSYDYDIIEINQVTANGYQY